MSLDKQSSPSSLSSVRGREKNISPHTNSYDEENEVEVAEHETTNHKEFGVKAKGRFVDTETQTSPILGEYSPTKSASPFNSTSRAPSSTNSYGSISNRPVTRTKTGTLRSRQNVNYEDDSLSDEDEYQPTKKKKKKSMDFDSNYGMGVSTVIRVNRIPVIFEKLKKILPCGEDEYDMYAIQTLILNCVMDIKTYKNEEELFHSVSHAVIHENFGKISSGWRNPLPKPSYDEEHDKRVISAYIEFMDSEEQQKERSYRYDSCRWTSEDWKKFEEALLLYPDGPTSNRKIAEYMGPHVHANHVAINKGIQRRKMKKANKSNE